MSDFWVFGYGSLIWNPGFELEERHRAKLHGMHRSLCVLSWVHRGTQDRPGLVLGLDKGGSCHGMAMRVSSQNRKSVIDYLRKREQPTAVYVEAWRNVYLDSGEKVSALVYHADQTHAQYTRGLTLDEQVEIVKVSRGGSGPNDEYVRETVAAMLTNNIRDKSLEYIAAKLKPKSMPQP